MKLILAFLIVFSSFSFAECFVVKAGAQSPFDGKSLAGLKVEKSSLAALNGAHRELNVTQGVFTGKVITCEDCSKDDHVTCK